MENIMSVKQELKEKNITDNTLLSNLDFAREILKRPSSQTVLKIGG